MTRKGPLGAVIQQAGQAGSSRATYTDVVNRLSHELGGPISVLRGYFRFWIDGTLDSAPWSTRDEIEHRAAQLDDLAKQAGAMVRLFARTPEESSGRVLDSWPRDAGRTLAGPIRELRRWLQVKDPAPVRRLSSESRTAILVCERSLILLEALVTQLATAHMVSGDELPEMEPIELSAWLRRSIHDVAPAVTCFGHPLALDFPSQPAPICGNSSLLAVALLNLLDNAQKFSPSRAPIQVLGYVKAGNCGFSVQDGGPGLPRDFEFRAFGRIDHGRGFAAPGVGLGLFTANRVAELHGGSLTIRTIERMGTVIGIEIPLNPDA